VSEPKILLHVHFWWIKIRSLQIIGDRDIAFQKSKHRQVQTEIIFFSYFIKFNAIFSILGFFSTLRNTVTLYDEGFSHYGLGGN
jgi:hypothetical protein